MEEGSMSSKSKNIKLSRVKSHTNVAKTYYSKDRESTQESLDMSPTYSWMINMIDQEFVIN